MTDETEKQARPARPTTGKVARGVAWAAIDNWTKQGMQLVAFVVIGGIVGPETFGIMAMALVYAFFVHAFLVDGFSEAIVQRLQVDREHLEAAFWTLAALGLIASIVGFSGAGAVAAFFDEPVLVEVIRWLSLSFAFVGIGSLLQAKLRREFKFRALAVRSAVVNGSSAALGIGLALAGYGIWSLVAYQLCLRVLDFAALLVLSRWLPRLRFSFRHLRDIFHFGSNTVASRLIDVVSHEIDRIIIGYFLNAATLGLYGLARRVLDAVTHAITGVLNTVALPTFSKIQDRRAQLSNALNSAAQATSLITFPVFAGLALVAPVMIETFLGAVWRPAAPILQILTLNGFCHAMAIFLMTTLLSVGRAGLTFRISLLATLLRTALYLWAIRYGVTGIAVASVAAAYMMLPVRLYVVNRVVGINFAAFAKGLLPATVATLVMVACVAGVRATVSGDIAPSLELVLLVAVGVAAYGAALSLIAWSSVQGILQRVRQA